MRVLYLVHNLSDPAVARRVLMLETGGAQVLLAGFRRGAPPQDAAGPQPIELGTTHDARFLGRAARVGLAAARLGALARRLGPPQLIIARNLEMLVLALRLRARLGSGGSTVPIVYECLDIHRLMLRDDTIGRTLRAVERWALAQTAALLTSSPAFLREHFATAVPQSMPVLMVENKPLEIGAQQSRGRSPRRRTGPLTIGWFGALRCKRSLDLLDRFTRAVDGRFTAILAGRPAATAIPNFTATVEAAPHLEFQGAYEADDLPALYGSVDFAWAIDFFEAGLNSQWLLPNRLYEGCAHGAVPIAVEGTETARALRERGIGIVLRDGTHQALMDSFGSLTRADHAHLSDRLRGIDRSAWVAGRNECENLVERLQDIAANSAEFRSAA